MPGKKYGMGKKSMPKNDEILKASWKSLILEANMEASWRQNRKACFQTSIFPKEIP